MRNKRPYRTYNGGKNGSGVYQAIINVIPPHDVFISAFAGNCGIMANKKKATMANIVIDTDTAVINDWKNIDSITGINADCLEFLPVYLKKIKERTRVLIYADPPYLLETRASKQALYKNEMVDPASHKLMLQYFNSINHNVIINHPPCKLYDKILKNWYTKDIILRTRSGIGIDRLYMNYQPPKQWLHDYAYIGGRLSAKRTV